MTLPPAFLSLLVSWGVDVEAFRAAYEDQVANKGLLPAEWLAKIVAILDQLGSTVTDPAAIAAAIAQALVAGYNPDAGGLA